MGLFDLPGPLFDVVDRGLGMALPPTLRLLLWGVFAGWLTMVFYRKLSNQERISELKKEQKAQQAAISGFDGEFEELLPLIRTTLGLGFRQLGLAIGPALLASLPVLFLVAWVAGQFGYMAPEPGQVIAISATPADASLSWVPPESVMPTEAGWNLSWPDADAGVSVSLQAASLLEFPLSHAVPIIHKKAWWNVLFANPLGYVPDDAALDQLDIALTPQQFIGFGPGWIRGWMFLFFMTFLVASIAFKFILKID